MSSFNFDPRGRRAIITGGAQGLGLEYARQLLSHGAKVCICDINTKLGEEAVRQLKDDYEHMEKDRWASKISAQATSDQ